MNTKELFDELVRRFPDRKVQAIHRFRSHDLEPEYYGVWIEDECAFTSQDIPIEKLIDSVAAKIPTNEQRLAKAQAKVQKAMDEAKALEAQLTGGAK